MGRFVAVAVMIAGMILPAGAQHSASRGEFSSHATPSSHGSFTASAPSRFSAPRAYSGLRPPLPAPGYQIARPTGRPGSLSARPAYNPAGRSRRPRYRSPYGVGLPYGYGILPWAGIGWIGPDLLDYPDTTGDSTAASPGYAPEGPDLYPAPPDEFAARPPYPSPSALSNPSPAAEKGTPVTLIFKDGRPSEQIQNYVLTPNTLTVWDGRRREIPVEQLDLAGTEKANRDAGVDFQPPISTMK